jgi:RNA polymerase sigma-70 factor (ECF subfamily)
MCTCSSAPAQREAAPIECVACRRWALAWTHRPELLAVARRRVPCSDDADDIVNEAMLRAVLYAELDEARIAAWLTRVVVNLCAAAGRERARAGKRRRYAQMMDMDVPTPEEVAVERAAASSACVRLGALPATQRDALLLRARGLPVGEVASELGVKYKAAESLLSRGRAAIRAALVAGVTGVLGGFRGLRRAPAPISGMAAVALVVAAWMPTAQPPPEANTRTTAPQFADATRAADELPAGDAAAAASQPAGGASTSVAEMPHAPRSGAAARRKVVAPVEAGAAGVEISGGAVTAQEHERPWQDELTACLLGGDLITPERVGCPPPEETASPAPPKDGPLSP